MINFIIKYIKIIFFKNFRLAIMSKRSANNSSEEPAFKKQVTNEAFEEMKTKINELKNQNEKLKQDQIEGQKMCQEQIEKFQERTAVAEDKLHEVKKIVSEIKKYNEKMENLKKEDKWTRKFYYKVFLENRNQQEKLLDLKLHDI